jgi:transposase, IS5 family
MGFRHLLQAHDLTKAVLVEINVMLMERGLLMSQVSLVDATLIAAPSPTKNKDHARDKEMHQTNKGNQWHFGMKAHIAVDKHSGLVHTVVSTQANVSDVSQAQALLHGQDSDVWAEAQSSKLKAQVRAYVEHPFHIVKNPFRYKKTRYNGLAKNDANGEKSVRTCAKMRMLAEFKCRQKLI